GMLWEDALVWADELNKSGYLCFSDWRVPNIKELQSIVDYTRSPDTTGSAAIDPLFNTTSITNEEGVKDYPYFWSSTTHVNKGPVSAVYGAYISFGRAMGYWQNEWMDVHGAGAQRSDPKFGGIAHYPTGHGPQGDAIRIYNHVRLVRSTDEYNDSDTQNDQDSSHCSVFDPEAPNELMINCLDIGGTAYTVQMGILSSESLRFVVDMDTFIPSIHTSGNYCAKLVSRDDGILILKINCLKVEGYDDFSAELKLLQDVSGIIFELVEVCLMKFGGLFYQEKMPPPRENRS
ncbi:MAG: DUF1566 domain-containing protein, partial [Desulfamplus sp.]|nr:DUF1566 domain-containing protein [Desulfamplus sp.]